MDVSTLFSLGEDDVKVTADDCYTPRWVFDAMGLTFDLDVAAPPGGPLYVPARRYYTAADDGLAQPWDGVVWCNPPYSNFGPWGRKWAECDAGCLMGTYTPGTAWFPGRVRRRRRRDIPNRRVHPTEQHADTAHARTLRRVPRSRERASRAACGCRPVRGRSLRTRLMTSRRTAISCRRCGAPGRWYLGGRLCPRHAPGGPDGEVMRAFPDYTGRIPQVMCDNGRTTETGPGNAANVPGPSPQHLEEQL